ncbi:MAG: hypothetical protein ABWZ74_06750 [Hyphomicrobiaceae bacterium]
MTAVVLHRTFRLLEESLRAWRIVGKVVRDETGGIVVTAKEERLLVTQAPEGVPFRWVVKVGARTRTAMSVTGVLGIVRQAIDPSYQPLRVRIAPAPVLPP